MGYDVSWHPISKEQMHEWYFDVLENMSLADKLKVRVPSEQLKDESQREEFEEFYLDKYKETLQFATTMGGSFSKTHAYIIAVIQGFFEEFFYTRGSAISFIEDDDFFVKYVTSWRDIAPKQYLENFQYNGFDENYSGGVYVSHAQVERLLHDYETDSRIKSILDNVFSHGRIEVFMSALHFAKDKGLGLLEATEVVEPHPQFGVEPSCYCNLFNCDPVGITLFQMACAEQINDAMQGRGKRTLFQTLQKWFNGIKESLRV